MLASKIVFYLWVFAHLISAVVLCKIVLSFIVGLLVESGAVVANYRQRSVVNTAGITIAIVWLMLIAPAMVLSVVADSAAIRVPAGFIVGAKIALPLSLLIVGASFFGFIDDNMGTREFSGFKGHIGALLKGRLTTGALKALGIPVIAIIASSLYSTSIFELLGNALLISLLVNTLNLFDLRPGRALKVYIPLQLIVMFTAGNELTATSAVLLGIAIAVIGPDLKEEIMLGDTGSNALGAALGFCLATGFDWNIKLPVIVLLILLQVLTERTSISGVIDETAFLRALDDHGRNKFHKKSL
jgi:UDP-GlcNAc:undecaprenyl-phosphate GlcNAc-1-phosphate transferase